MRGAEVVFHTAGYVGSKPEDAGLAAERARAAAGRRGGRRRGRAARRRHLDASPRSAPRRAGEIAEEGDVYRGGDGLAYGDSKHEGEAEAFAAGARLGVEVVVGQPGLRARRAGRPQSSRGRRRRGSSATTCSGGCPPSSTAARTSSTSRTSPTGHLLAAERGRARRALHPRRRQPGLGRADRPDRVAVRRTPPDRRAAGRGGRRRPRAAARCGCPSPIAPEGIQLMAQNWRCVVAQGAHASCGYRTRPVDETLRDDDRLVPRADRSRRVRRAPAERAVGRVARACAPPSASGVVERRCAGVERWSGRRLVAGG